MSLTLSEIIMVGLFGTVFFGLIRSEIIKNLLLLSSKVEGILFKLSQITVIKGRKKT